MASIKKNLRQIGNSYGVILPKLILEMANINPILDEVELYIENNEIRIRKIKKDWLNPSLYRGRARVGASQWTQMHYLKSAMDFMS